MNLCERPNELPEHFMKTVTTMLKIRQHMDRAHNMKHSFSILSRLWKIKTERIFILEKLFDFQMYEVGISATVCMIKHRITELGLTKNFSSFKTGNLVRHLYLLKSYVDGDELGDESDDDFYEDSELVKNHVYDTVDD